MWIYKISCKMLTIKIFKYYYIKLSKSLDLPIPSYNFHTLIGINNCSLTQVYRK